MLKPGEEKAALAAAAAACSSSAAFNSRPPEYFSPPAIKTSLPFVESVYFTFPETTINSPSALIS